MIILLGARSDYASFVREHFCQPLLAMRDEIITLRVGEEW